MSTDLSIRRTCKLRTGVITGLARHRTDYRPEYQGVPCFKVASGQKLSAVVAVRDRFPIKGLTVNAEIANGLPVSVSALGLLNFPEEATHLPDPLLESGKCDVSANSTMTYILQMMIPEDTSPGRYRGSAHILADSHEGMDLEFDVDILPGTLRSTPYAPKINFWPNWTVFCRTYDLELWSTEFWSLAEKFLAELATGGMNVITVAVLEDAFRYPLPPEYYHMNAWPSMIRWIRHADGNYRFDYDIYDRYVELNMRLGINAEIECHSMLPCKMQTPWLTYYDEKEGRTVSYETDYTADDYLHAWEAFLADFAEHNRRRGWLDKITICPYDEPQDIPSFRMVADIVRRVAPEMRVTAAIMAEKAWEGRDALDIVTFNPDYYDAGIHRRLEEEGKEVRWYNCCAPMWGNTLLHCPLSDAYRIPWITVANSFKGYLRWSAFNWTDEPWTDPAFNWPTGDTYLLYPGKDGPVTGLRWEAYKMGLSDLHLLLSALEEASPDKRCRLQEHLRDVGRFSPVEGPQDLQAWRDKLYDILFGIEQ
ncbi:MAG: DUF4091 domain-containing protein [bacterium]|nr:DUF4091 domain-containing protein [bacterium]